MTVVFSIGGSVVAENLDRVEELADALQREEQVVAVTGAGPLARYIEASSGNQSEKDLIGIQATRLHAKLLATEMEANSRIPETPEDLKHQARSGEDVVTGGFVPGYSTDAVAATAAEMLEAKLYLPTTVDGVYTAEPEEEDAERLEQVDTERLRRLIAGNSSAGGYELIDEVAVSLIERSSIPARLFRGTIENIESPDEARGTDIVHS